MNIKETRIKAGYTQEDTARKLDISLRQYVNIESEKNLPNIRTGLKIAKLFKVDPYRLWPI